MEIGIVGLGRMGGNMAVRLVRGGTGGGLDPPGGAPGTARSAVTARAASLRLADFAPSWCSARWEI